MDVKFVVITQHGGGYQAVGFETMEAAILYQDKLWYECAVNAGIAKVETPGQGARDGD